jgi:hypothetical protein
MGATLLKQAESTVKEAVVKPKDPYRKLVAKFG